MSDQGPRRPQAQPPVEARPRPRRVLTASVLMLLLAGALGVAAHAQEHAPVGPVHSANLELLSEHEIAPESPFPVTMSGRKVGNRFYVPEFGTGLHVFDVSRPTKPRPIGFYPLPHALENEDIATNGRVALMTQGGLEGAVTHSSDRVPERTGASKLVVLDVRDPSDIRPLATLAGAGAHTYHCLYDCDWAYGSDGQIIDLRDALHGRQPVQSEKNWLRAVGASLAHDVFEVRPGRVVTGTLPNNLVLDTRDPLDPVVLARSDGTKPSFHQVSWPDAGGSPFILGANEGQTGSRSVRCEVTKAEDNDATPFRTAFQVWDVSGLSSASTSGRRVESFTETDHWRPENGSSLDGADPLVSVGGSGWSNGGCALHYFDPHPSFDNGGLVAQSAFAHGLRLLHVDRGGKIKQVGHYLPLGADTKAAYWITPSILYALDNGRLHVLQYTR